jgi:hypothetical protein
MPKSSSQDLKYCYRSSNLDFDKVIAMKCQNLKARIALLAARDDS